MTGGRAGAPDALGPALTVRAAVDRSARTLTGASPTPRLDAEVLVHHVRGATRSRIVADADRPLSSADRRALAALVARRRRGEPVAYLTGRREFWSLDLVVTPATLIPRPETELLVERALARIPETAEWTAADSGTGSGAVALALAHERARLRVVATDRFAAALAVARRNAERLEIRNVAFVRGDWLDPLGAHRFHVIVSNPPYVCSDDPRLRAGELRFEPRAALDGGRDGLDAIRRLIRDARARLVPEGWLLLEHGFDQGAEVRALLRGPGYRDVRTYQDLAGHERVTEGRAAWT